MKKTMTAQRLMAATGLALALLVFSGSASALDAAYSRKGPFAGFGLGGGVGLLTTADVTALGDVGFNLQAGIGAKDQITISFNFDAQLEIGNDTTMGMFIPGPEFAFFVVKDFFIQVGAGPAIVVSDDLGGTIIGMDTGIKFGYEFWVNTNWAAYVTVGVDYFLLNDAPDLVNMGFWFGLRYY